MREHLYVGPSGVVAYPVRRGKHLDLGLVREAIAALTVGGTTFDAATPDTPADAREALREGLLREATTMLEGFRLPSAAVAGTLREASARFTERVQSLSERVEAVSDAVRQRYRRSSPLEGECYGYAEQVYEDSVLVRERTTDGKVRYWSLGYTVAADGSIALAEAPVEFEMVWKPKEAVSDLLVQGDTGAVISYGAQVVRARESATPGGVWDILVIEEGLSLNRNRYRGAVLAEAAPLYEGRPIYVNHTAGGQPYGRGVEELGGFLRGVRPTFLLQEGASKRLAVAATACLTLPWLREAMRNAAELDNPGLYGFSHDVEASFQVIQEADGPVSDVTKITKVESVDVVTTPAAGGRAQRLVASVIPGGPIAREEQQRMNVKQMIEAIRKHRADLLAKLGDNPEAATPEQVFAVFEEALKPVAAPAPTPAPMPAPVPASADAVRMSESVAAELFTLRSTNVGLLVDKALAECALPDLLKQRLAGRFRSRIGEAKAIAALPTEPEIVAMIKEAVEDYGALAEAKVVMPVTTSIVETKTRLDQAREALDEFWDPTKPARSFRGVYVGITGDTKLTGKVAEALLLREALSTTSWAEMLGDSITRRAVKEYNGSPLMAQWKGTFVEVVPATDFRVQRRVRFGGYGNLSVVAQGGAYPMLTSPTDEEATYSISKRGGTESVTMEMIRNDDVQAIRRIPARMGRSAAQTVHEFVFDFLKDNPTIYDGAALATAPKGNLNTNALSNTQLIACRTQMKKQADMSSGKRLGLSPRYLFHPLELSELAFQLTRSQKAIADTSVNSTAASAAESFAFSLGITPHQVDYWTDANDYAFTESVQNTPIVEVAFLDGQEEPELVVQDMPAVGQMFSNDQLTWKIRHVYGGGVVDYRGVVLGRV